MERINHLQQTLLALIQDTIKEYPQQSDYPDVELHPFIDEKNHRYGLMAVGWIGEKKRVFNIFFQADIINDKIWIQEDNNEYSVAEQLEDRGISKNDIVLAYYPKFHRSHMAYAVA